MTFAHIIRAAERAQLQFDDLHGSPEDNCAVLKELAVDVFRAFYGLVEDADGDPDYIRSWKDGIADDLDRAFTDAIERHADAVTASRFTGHNSASRLERSHGLTPVAAE